ncbi:MAG: acetate--CoA ligase family protein [Candidatus Bipolaricaulota bacterium]|nr:acetate--CoA ligase family protein [Candidatus Bipolaricaulota bacterium]
MGIRTDIDYLFEPRGVAVIGASQNTAKIGYRIVENIVQRGYKGKIYPINPKGGEVLGLKIYSDLSAVDGDVDIAVITIPAQFVFDAVRECAVKHVKHLLIITSGFSEVGNTEEEREIVAYAREHGMRVLGPNIFGIYSAAASLDATFGPGGILPGRVAIITQSGALGIAMIGKTAAESLGLSSLVSIGNKGDIDESDVLEYLEHDEATKVIFLYIEGVKDGDRLVETLNRVTRKKHVIVVKSGRSKRGAMAAASHTGSLAGADEIFDSIMRQCGVLRAESVQEAFNWAHFLSDAPLPEGKESIIVTNGGGIGVLTTDACEKYGVALYDNQTVLKETFAPVMPSFGSSKNPIDLTGQATAEDYERSLEAILDNNDMHAVIALYCETALFDTDALADLLRVEYERYKNKKPVIFSLFGGEKLETVVRTLRAEGIPVFSDVYDSASCLGALYRSWENVNTPKEKGKEIQIDVEAVETILDSARVEKRGFLLANEAQEMSEVLGLSMPGSIVANNLDEAVQAAEKIGYPVVMKVVSKDIIHKSDAGGVALNLENKNEVIDAYQAIMRSCREYKADALIQGVEVVEMVKPGVETIIGARQDASFGPIVMFGLGGIYVEVMKDVAFRAAPISKREAHAMVSDIRSYPLLLGVRGEKRKEIDGIVDVAMKLGALIDKCRDITDIEINPLVVYEHGQGVKAVDVRILFQTTREVR